MSQTRVVEVDRTRLDARRVERAARQFGEGTLAVLPTDTSYVIACRLGDTAAIRRLRQARGLDDGHLLTMLLADFTSLGQYAVVDNAHFRLLKSLVPGPYTFIMRATKVVPSAFAHKKRKTVGLRIPDDEVVRAFAGALDTPLVSASLKPPGFDGAVSDIGDHGKWIGKVAGTVISAGPSPGGETSILDLSSPDGVTAVRQGAGDTSFLDG